MTAANPHGEHDDRDEPAARASTRARASTFASLTIPNFRYLWLGQLGHAAGTWMELAARPFLIFELTDSASIHLGAVLVVRTVPQFLFGIWAGVLADHFDRRTILLLDKSAALALNVIFAAVLLAGQIELWHIYVYAFARGTVLSFDQPAREGLIPTVVPRHLVTNAVALMSATQNTMRIFGAALGGGLYALFGAEGAFSLIAIVYVLPVVATYRLSVPKQVRTRAATAGNFTSSLVEGLRFAWSNAAIRGVLILSAIYFMFGMAYMQVFSPLFAEQVLDVGSAGFAGMTALAGLAALVATLFIAQRQPDRLGMLLLLLAVLFGGLLVLFSVTSYLPRPAGIILPFLLIALVGAVQTSYMSLSRAILLHSSPEELRSRVIGLLTLDRAFMMAGAAGGGFLSHLVGVQLAQIVFGLVCMIGGAVVYMSAREFRRARASDRHLEAPPAPKRPAAEPATAVRPGEPAPQPADWR